MCPLDLYGAWRLLTCFEVYADSIVAAGSSLRSSFATACI